MINKNKFQILCISCLITLFTSSLAWAGGRPSDSEMREWFGQFSAGWQYPQGHTKNVIEDSFWLSGGAIYWPSQWPAGINLNLGYTNPDITGDAINYVNQANGVAPGASGSVDGGDVTIWKLTVDAIWSLGKDKSTGLYLTGGGGAYYIDTQLTTNGLVAYPPYCDPWFYWCVPGYVGPGSYVAASQSNTQFGWDAGMGYSFKRGSLVQWFIEAKYNYIYTESKDSAIVPLEVGVRW